MSLGPTARLIPAQGGVSEALGLRTQETSPALKARLIPFLESQRHSVLQPSPERSRFRRASEPAREDLRSSEFGAGTSMAQKHP